MCPFWHLCLVSATCLAIEKRDNSIMSSLTRYVLQRSNFNKGDQEYSRVTQAPLVKVHLHKVFLPTSLHASQKGDLGERIKERANDVERDNSRERDAIAAVIESMDELETLTSIPLQRLNSHNYTERKFNEVYPVELGVRKPYAGMMGNPIGLSDYAVLSSEDTTGEPARYIIMERRKLKPSELDMEDNERAHVPIFVERGDQPAHLVEG